MAVTGDFAVSSMERKCRKEILPSAVCNVERDYPVFLSERLTWLFGGSTGVVARGIGCEQTGSACKKR